VHGATLGLMHDPPPEGGPHVAESRRQFLRRLSRLAVAASVPAGLWHLGRSQREARAAPAVAGRGRQWAMVIDLRKCEGCVTIGEPPQCTVACGEAHHLRPEQAWLPVYEVATERGTYYQPTPCMQCENAPCVKVCPVGATYHDSTGVVLVDNQVCIGCRMCMAACPYGARTFNWDEPPETPGVSAEQYTPEASVPQRRGTVSKCMFCAHQAVAGRLPECAQGCPMDAIYFGDLVQDVATNGKELVRLSEFLGENHAYQLKPEYGTRPRVHYIPGHGEAFGRGLR
jgi:Fe-S-cluster-containing dehydrogenase component